MASINTYLSFNGNAEEVFEFYKSVFGGEFQTLMRMSDVPAEHKAAPGEENQIMHVSLPIGRGTVLMGCDVPAKYGPVKEGSNFTVAIQADSKDEADTLFNGLSAGGKVTMAMDNTFWGSYFGMFTDKFGIQWMVGYDHGNR